MGKYSVPDHIRAMKPRGTMVKAIDGRYYVYDYACESEGGVRRTRMGRCVGKIVEGEGFVPNAGASESANAAVRAAADRAAGAPTGATEASDATEVARLRARVAALDGERLGGERPGEDGRRREQAEVQRLHCAGSFRAKLRHLTPAWRNISFTVSRKAV